MLGRATLKFNRAACPYVLCASMHQRMWCTAVGDICVPKRVDGTRFNNRLVSDLKKALIRIPFLDGVFGNKDEKGGKVMKEFCRKVKEFFKSGIKKIVEFCKENKKSIIKLVGKFVIYACKTIIELILDNLF